MRAVIILCLFAVACADKLGYNYHPVDHSDGGLSFAPGGGAASSDSPSYSGSSSLSEPSYSGSPSSSEPSYSGSPSSSDPSYGGAPGGELEKEFYTFTANDDDFIDPAANEQVANSVKQGLRVIFIKGPENKALENAALSLAKQAGDQQTAIYVLNKQVDIGDLANKLNAIRNNNNNHPDVHFVKYRTPADAANAQHAIQSQYDQLGGPSQSHDGGVAPVINFASPSSSHPVQQQQIGGRKPGNAYLPSSVLRLIRKL